MTAKGKVLEQDTEKSVPDGWMFERLKDAPPPPPDAFKGKSFTRFTPKNICDCVIGNPISRTVYWIEQKEESGTSLSFSRIDMKNLKKLVETKGNCKYGFTKALFQIKFTRKRSGCYFVDANLIKEYIDNPPILRGSKPTCSFPYDWVVKNGTLIPERLKKVRYHYYLDEVL